MNLTWHIVKKDLRALKWPLLLWFLVIVAKLGVGVAMLTATGSVNSDWFANWFVRMGMFTTVFAALECVSFVLVAAVIHEDLLVGTTAFWMTRPISGGRLLGAKILGIGLIFFVLPVLVTLPWWLACGYGLREIAWAALETVVVQLVCILLGLLWGVVTDGYARFLLWTLVLLFAIPTIGGMISMHFSNLGAAKPTPDLVLTRVWVAIAIAVLAVPVVSVHQFLTRRTSRSVGLIASAVAGIVAIGMWWPWDLELQTRWDAYRMARAEWNSPLSPEPPGLQFVVETPRLAAPPGAPTNHVNQIQMKFSVTGLPDGQELVAGGGRYTLRWLDGSVTSGWSWVRRTDRSLQLAAWKSLGLPAQPGVEADGQRFSTSVFLPLATVARVQAEAPAFTLQAPLRLVKFDAATKLPLAPGARIMNGSSSERVAYVGTEDRQIWITFIRTRSDFVVDRLINQFASPGSVYSLYALINQAAGKLDQGIRQWNTSSRIASVSVSLQIMAYGDGSPVSKKERAKLPESWLRNAELIRVGFSGETRFAHEIKFARFPVEP